MIGPERIVRNFFKFEKSITNYVKNRVDNYYNSRCYFTLKNRVKRLDNSVDLRNTGKGQNYWNSKIAIPYGHESFLMTRATLNQSFKADPLISLQPLGDTPWQNAINAQEMAAQNFKSTRFKDRTFKQIVKTTSRFGSCPVVHHFEHRPEIFTQTVEGEFGIERQRVRRLKQNVKNQAIHPLNYFQNPDIADPEESDFRGWIDRWNDSRLFGLVESMPELYIKKNLKKVLLDAKKSEGKSEHFFEDAEKDYHGMYSDIVRVYTTLNFEGNEEDETIYFLEMVGDVIIRIQENPNDFNLVPISIYSLDQRTEYWWANTPVEKTIPMENYANILMSMTADNLFRATQNFLFYPSGKIDVAAINDRHKNGGWIPVEPQVFKDFGIPVKNWQRPEISTGPVQYMMGEMKEALQRTQAKPDTQRKGVQGGPTNNTATAFEGQQAIAGTLAFDYISEFAIGLRDTGRANVIMLQQRLNDKIQLRPNPKEAARIIHKREILGDFEFQVESALNQNTQAELLKTQNAITWLMNLAAGGRQE